MSGRKGLLCVVFFLTATLSFLNNVSGQQASIKHINNKFQHYYDSLKNMNYDRMFPIYGDRVYKKGFDIPFPFGIMINNFYGVQDILINNVRIGVKSSDGTKGPVNVDSIIKFGNVQATAFNVNLRADVWLFPFFNVYGLLAYLPYAKTKVELTDPVSITTEPKQSGWAYGFGGMVAFGIGPVWLQGDYNMTWADMQLLSNKVFTQIAGIRMGHVFPMKSNPEKNISVWIGAMGIFLNSGTVGEIKLSDVFPGMSEQQADQAQQNYTANPKLTPPQKEVLDKIIEKIKDQIANRPIDDTYVTYELDKKPKSNWAGLAGIQYQFNKRWQLRAESNFLGQDRYSVLLSINYRFLGFKKNTPAK